MGVSSLLRNSYSTGATQPRCFTDVECQGASLPEAGDTCCRVPAAQRYLPTTAGAQQCLPCFSERIKICHLYTVG